MKILFIFLYFFLLFKSELFAASIYTITNEPAQESIDSIILKFTPQYGLSIGNRSQIYRKYLLIWNPHIENWTNIPTGTKIYVESPSLPLQEGEMGPHSVSSPHNHSPEKFENTKLYFLFTSSAGNFKEKLLTPEGGNINSSQNSPYSFGLAGLTNFSNSSNYLGISAYWSKLNPTPISGDATATNLLVPAEYGFNTYFGHPLVMKNIRFSIYGGLDFENFSTYNTIQFINRAELGFNQNKLLFGTIGLDQVGFWHDHQLNIKFSVSKSLLSGTSSTDRGDRFSGYKFLFFTNYQIYNRVNFHLLYKRHQLMGPTALTIDRYGIGIGLTIF